MPFKSKAQRRFMFAAEAEGALKSGTARRWAEHTRSTGKLPERVKESAKKKAPSRWEGATRGSGSGLATAGLLAGTAAGTLLSLKDLKRGKLVSAGKRIAGVGGAGWMTGALAGTAKGALKPKTAAKKNDLKWHERYRPAIGGATGAALGSVGGVTLARKKLRRIRNPVLAGAATAGAAYAGGIPGMVGGAVLGARSLSPEAKGKLIRPALVRNRRRTIKRLAKDPTNRKLQKDLKSYDDALTKIKAAQIIMPSRTGAAQGTPIAGSSLVAPAQRKLIIPGAGDGGIATAPRKKIILPGQEAGAAARSSGGIILPERTSARPRTESKAPQFSKREKAIQEAADAEMRSAREKPKASPKPAPKPAPKPEVKAPTPKPEVKAPTPKPKTPRPARAPRGRVMESLIKHRKGLGLAALATTGSVLAYKALKKDKPKSQGRQKAASTIAVEAGARHAMRILVG